jgi:tRNA(adenine34) deaminase
VESGDYHLDSSLASYSLRMPMATRKSEPDDASAEFLHDRDEIDRYFMGFALEEARLARQSGEVPIGAIVTLDRQVIGVGRNAPIGLGDPTAHAEILALRAAAKIVENYRLTNAVLYATIEPCAMCAGAIVNARIKRLVYGAADLRAGGVDTIFQICSHRSLNHQVEVTSGVRQDEARGLMQRFFQERRNPGAATRSEK